jgi:energy-converting hydrogenase A subunit M
MSKKLNILIATIDNRILGLKNIIKKYNVDCDIIYSVSHQITKKLTLESLEYIEILKRRNDVIYSSIFSRGVAKNRNNCLKLRVPGSICLLADDDIVYFDESFNKILKIFEEEQNIDFLTFKIKTFDEKDYKIYKNYTFKHNIRTLSNIGIIDVAFREECILKYDLRFDERFGPGSKYPIGEDFIFMTDALKKGANIIFKPIDIVMHGNIGTGQLLKDRIIFGRGAMFARVFNKLSYMVNLYFAFKQYKNYKNKYTFFKYIHLLFLGTKSYFKQKKIKE